MAFEDDSPTIECPHCGHTIYAQARFCRRCGKSPESAAPPACAKCGAVAEATDAFFCSKCGAAMGSVAPDAETRALAVPSPRREHATIEPLPFSSLPERPARNFWPWGLGFVILVASAIAGVTHRDKLTTWLQVPASQQTRATPPMKAMEAVISAYYDAIGNQDFKTAYSLWTPSMQKGLTPSDLANQWYSQWLGLGANGAQVNVNLNVTMSEPPDGDFIPTTVTETEPYADGYIRKKVLKGGWHVVNIGGRWLLNERDFKTVADNGPPPTSPVNDGMGSSHASNAGASAESGTPSSASQGASSEAGTNCPEQQNLNHFILHHPDTVPPPPPDTGLGYFEQQVSQLSVAQQQIVYQRSVAYSPWKWDDLFKVLANHCRLADFESLPSGPTKYLTAAWNTADYAPNAQDEESAIKASVELAAGVMAAELAVEARGLVSETVVERLYIAFEPVIPLSTIPMKFREGSVTALSSGE